MEPRYDYGLTRYRMPEDGVKFEPEGTTFGKIEDAAAKLAEWSDGKLVVLEAAEYAALRASYEAGQRQLAEAEAKDNEPVTGEPTPDAPTTGTDAVPDDAWPQTHESGIASPTPAVDHP